MANFKLTRWLAAAFLATPAILMSTLQGQQTASTYDPGIRAETPASTQAEKAAEDAWCAHMQALAGDELQGRKTGTDQFLRAADYVASQFKAMGLGPAGVDGYLQPVGFRNVSVDAERSSFALASPDGQVRSIQIGNDLSLAPNLEGTSSVEASAVFAGRGLVVPVLGIDDLKGLDLHGKIAVIFLDAPPAVHGPLKAYYRTAAIRWPQLKAAGGR